jgi:hypothetical protein
LGIRVLVADKPLPGFRASGEHTVDLTAPFNDLSEAEAGFW